MDEQKLFFAVSKGVYGLGVTLEKALEDLKANTLNEVVQEDVFFYEAKKINVKFQITQID